MKKIKAYLTDQTASYTIALCAAVALFLGLSNLDIVVMVWNKIIGVFSPFIYAFALAFILNRPVMWFEKKVFTHPKYSKPLSILVVYIIAITVVTGLLLAVIPQLGLSISYIIDTLPEFLRRIYAELMVLVNRFHWSRDLIIWLEDVWAKVLETITEFSFTAIPEVITFSFSLGSGIIKILMVLIISVYMVAGKDKLKFQMKKTVYAVFSKPRADRLVGLAHRADKIFAGFIIGKLIDSTIIGIMCFAGMLFIYPDYTVLFAVVIGITNMIPFFGPFIGAIPCVFILLMVSPMTAAVFAVFVLLLQQFDGNILGPKILGDSLGLPPIWVLVGILVGNGLFGLVGMLIGVPAFAVLYSIVSEHIAWSLKGKGLEANTETFDIDYSKGVENDAI